MAKENKIVVYKLFLKVSHLSCTWLFGMVRLLQGRDLLLCVQITCIFF